jgi:phage tail sheath protein FI
MPEYLAPGVYVEEVEIGAKPIEGVSTSTAGFLGYAERGPLNKPTLVTSFAEFELIFGGFLPAKSGDGKDLSEIRWLAYAVQGFFENGGKRVFVTRVAADGAVASSGSLPRVVDGTPMVLAKKASQNETGLVFTTAAGFAVNDRLLLKDGDKSEFIQYLDVATEIILEAPTLANAYAVGTTALGGKKAGSTSTTLAEGVLKGATEIKVASASGIAAGKYLLLGESELVVVVSVAGTAITIQGSLCADHSSGDTVFKIAAVKEATLIRKAVVGDGSFYTDTAAADIAVIDFLFIGCEYLKVSQVTAASNAYLVSPALKYDHDANKEVIKLESAVEVSAASKGKWGDSLKVSVKPSTLSSAKLTKVADVSKRLDLETINGIETGSVLRLPASASPRYVKVEAANKTSTDTYVTIDQAVTLSSGDKVETDEFDLTVSDGSKQEVFKNLSLDEEHSRYIKKIVTEKSSNFITIGDITASGTVMALPTTDDLPGWYLTGGDDGFPADPTKESDINPIYEGADSMEPADRTGLYTFKNVDEINIAAIPGVTSKYLQQKLITHCEVDMKDRFAVLDSMATADLDEIKEQRNLFDTSYAALYYPWLYMYDPLSKDYINIPPSGHVCGIYARTDVERGVHKAPANEKINGAVNTERLNGSYRIINKGTQEILNPLGVNCTRIFPGRGIRVWGARTMSSNSLWKYVNVRRLFLFLEESIEDGTQWVVFEPNDQKLWARVIQTITQFLTSVWKSGALMGATPEEAFFVKCDRTTMTQSDIDNGRLIVLIGVAPVKPAEFVIFRIAQWQGGSAATE